MDLQLRPIARDDKPTLVRFHARLSEDTRYRRYHAYKGALSRGDLKFLTEVDGEHHIAVVAETADGEFAGVARAVAFGPEDAEGHLADAELAIVVADDVQAGGVGARLVGELVARCRDKGFERLLLEVQGDNHRALAFFQHMGARQLDRHHSVCRLVLETR